MSQPGSQSIQSVLKETRTFAPPATFSANAHISSEQQYEAMWNRAKDDPAGFWGEMAGNLEWFRKWDTVIQGHMPDTKWFVGLPDRFQSAKDVTREYGVSGPTFTRSGIVSKPFRALTDTFETRIRVSVQAWRGTDEQSGQRAGTCSRRAAFRLSV
jgi:hypothetical protein